MMNIRYTVSFLTGLLFFISSAQAGWSSFFGGVVTGGIFNRAFFPCRTYAVVRHVEPVRTVVYRPHCCYKSPHDYIPSKYYEVEMRLQQAQADLEELRWQNQKLARKVQKLKNQ